MIKSSRSFAFVDLTYYLIPAHPIYTTVNMALPPWRRNNNNYLIPIQPQGLQQQSPVLLPPGLRQGDEYSASVSYPPPGLIQVTMSRHISTDDHLRERRGKDFVITDSDVSLFSDIAAHLETGHDMYGNRIICDLTCGICHGNNLEMPNCVSPICNLEGSVRTEPLSVLPCGHMFGAWCLDSWMASCRDEDRESSCPICRFPLHYEYCGHEIRIRHYDPRFYREGQLPLTIPEGGCVPAYCKWCRVNYVKDMADRMAQAVYPREVPESAFKDKTKVGPNDFREMRAVVRSFLLDSFYQGEEYFDHW